MDTIFNNRYQKKKKKLRFWKLFFLEQRAHNIFTFLSRFWVSFKKPSQQFRLMDFSQIKVSDYCTRSKFFDRGERSSSHAYKSAVEQHCHPVWQCVLYYNFCLVFQTQIARLHDLKAGPRVPVKIIITGRRTNSVPR